MNKFRPKKIIIIKSVLREMWVNWIHNRIYVFDIHANNDVGCTGIEPAVSSSAEELNQNVLTIQPRKFSGELNIGKYIDRRSNDVVTLQTLWMICKKSGIDCISSAQVRWNIKLLFTSNIHVFSRIWVEVTNSFLRRLN